MKKWSCIVCLLVFLTACKKKVLEIVPVMEVEKDMSIQTTGSIRYFSFPSESIGYAAADSGFIYKTIDGGLSWNIITVAANKKCRGLEFFTNSKGICLMDRSLYSTANGGISWSLKNSDTDFIGKTINGIGVSGKCTPNSCSIKTSNDSSVSFQSVGNINISGDFISARVVDSKVFVFTKDVFYYDELHGFDLITNQSITIDFDNITNNPSDIYLSGSTGCVTGVGGDIMEDEFGVGYDRTYYSHSYNYYSVDGYNGFIVCVGDKTIASNLDIGTEEKWNEVFDTKGNGFTHTFYKIRFINANSFYISGSKGLLIKAKI